MGVGFGSRVAGALSTALAALVLASAAHAAGCLKDERSVTLADGQVTRLSSYLCKTADSGASANTRAAARRR